MESKAVKGSCSELLRPQTNAAIRQNPKPLLGIELFEDRQRPFGIRHTQNKKALFRRRHGGQVAVVDVDLPGGEGMGDPGEAARFVVVLDHQHVALNDQCAVRLKECHCQVGIADNHPNNCMIRGVGDGESVDVDLRAGKGITD